MVGTLAGTDAYFRREGYGGTESHFGVGGDGLVYQWQDTDHQADANLEGNHRVVSVETADHGAPFPAWSGSDVPAWTTEQVEAIAALLAWLCRRYTIPCELIPDTRPGRRGIGYHRQGVDPWRVDGGERWSTAYGKVCPGDRRVAQIETVVIPRTREIMEDATMPTVEEIWAHPLVVPGADPVQRITAGGMVRTTYADVRELRARVGAVEAVQAQILAAVAGEVGLTAEQVSAAAKAGAEQALAEGVDLRVSVTDDELVQP